MTPVITCIPIQIVVNSKSAKGGCVGSITVLGIPAFFSPNGDGVNDVCYVSSLRAINRPEIFIFDRYGKLIFGFNPLQRGWDGTFEQNNLPSTDYWFKLLFDEKDNTGQSYRKEIKGHFSLLR